MDQKLHAEIAKLRAEEAQISQPWWTRPAYLGSIIPAIVALVTIAQLLSTGYWDTRRREIGIQTKALEYETMQLETRKKELTSLVNQLQGRIATLEMEEGRLVAVTAINALDGIAKKNRAGDYEVELKDSSTVSLTALNAHLRTLEAVHLGLDGVDIDDADLQELVSVKTLTSIDFSRTAIGDSGLAHLKSLPNLRDLKLSNTRISDAGLEHLGAMVKLERLDLTANRITGAGLSHLVNLTQLRSLRLNICDQVDDRGMVFLRRLSSLTELQLDDTGISDEGLIDLGVLRTLEQLDLNNTRISDRGLRHLSSLSALARLGLANTDVSAQAVQKLQQSLPDCEVVQ